MKASERDELLARLDERSINTYTLVEKQERHLAQLNDQTSDHTKQITKNSTSIKWIRYIIGGTFTGIVAIILKVVGVY